MTIHTVADLIRDLGGARHVAKVLERRSGRKLSEKAVYKWRERGSLPARWIMPVLAECQDKGLDVSLVRLHALAERAEPEPEPVAA